MFLSRFQNPCWVSWELLFTEKDSWKETLEFYFSWNKETVSLIISVYFAFFKFYSITDLVHGRAVGQDPFHFRCGTPMCRAVNFRPRSVAEFDSVRRFVQEQWALHIQTTTPYYKQNTTIVIHMFIQFSQWRLMCEFYWRYCPRSGLIHMGIIDILGDSLASNALYCIPSSDNSEVNFVLLKGEKQVGYC